MQLPLVGLGTFRARGSEVQQAVAEALRVNIRHIDTASIYKNEAEIAQALAQAGVPREQVFLTSKVSPYELGQAKAREACEGILQRLAIPGVEPSYIDLVLIHWPGVARTDARSPLNAQLRREAWEVLEEYHAAGRFRSIGVSNYTVPHLRELLGYCRIRPAVNQVEAHPRWQQRELAGYCRQEGIAIVAYASLGCGELLGEEAVVEVAAHCGTSPAQVLLAWGLRKGFAVIPKSVHPEYIRQYEPALLLGLSQRVSEAQVAALDALGAQECKFCWDPSGIL